MSYFEECLKKFEELPLEFKGRIGSLESFEKIEAIENEYGVDLKFLIVLLAIGELSLRDAPEYLQAKHQIAEEDAYEIRDAVISDIFELTADFDIPGNLNEYLLKSKKEIINIFREGLADILKNKEENKNEYIDSLNIAIFSWLAKDGLLQDLLSKALFDNQERLTTGLIVIENKKVGATISNWLKDFIKINSGEFFNDIVLAQYLTVSENVKNLSTDEKDLVRKLLKTYRNIGFFPDSMQNLAINDWQIIPVDRIRNNKKYSQDVLSDGADPKSQKIIKIESSMTEKEPPSSRVDQVIVEPSGGLIAELEIMLQDYDENSLEYKTIQQEIKRLQAKK